jgi:predicted nucleotidyltransferase
VSEMPDRVETPYPEANKLVELLASRLSRILEARLVGLYLYGSLVSGDFDPRSSDVDLLAVTSAELTEAEFSALHAMHLALVRDNTQWEDRIEVAYVPAEALRTFRTAISPIAVVSPGEPFHMRNQERMQDWLQNWYLVRNGALTLCGLPPEAIIPAISHEEFVLAIRDYALALSQSVPWSRKGQVYLVLTLCRSLYVDRTGQHASKREGARWAQREFPEWARLIQGALSWRDGGVDPESANAESARFADFVREQLLR